MRASDFYGNVEPVVNSGDDKTALDAPTLSVSTKPVHFWFIMVALLVAARLLYERAE